MQSNCVLMVGIVLVLLVGGGAAVETEVKGSQNSGLHLEKTTNSTNGNHTSNAGTREPDSSSNFHKLDQVHKGNDQVGGSKKSIDANLSASNSSRQSETKESHDERKNKGNGGDAQNQKQRDGSKSKEVAKQGGDGGNAISAVPVRKEDCDPSNMCTDEENKLVACLRVPGNESPHLSLLIQNKCEEPLSVTISAPKSVQIRKTRIQLQPKEDKKVKVSIRAGGADTFIILTAGHGKCSLDFRDLVPHGSWKQSDSFLNFASSIFLTRASTVVFISFGALLILATAWMCANFRKKHFPGDSSKYQKLDMELPVSGGDKSEMDANEGWDNSWGDSWDDEEAPKTPSMPVTPSLLSKGLASRRLNKEGWKD